MVRELWKFLRKLKKLSKDPGIVFREASDGREVRRGYVVVTQVAVRRVRRTAADTTRPKTVRLKRKVAKKANMPIVYEDVGKPILEEWFQEDRIDSSASVRSASAPVDQLAVNSPIALRIIPIDPTTPSRFGTDEEPTAEELQQEESDDDTFRKGIEADFQELLEEYDLDEDS